MDSNLEVYAHHPPNCVGFVYKEMGLTPTEKFIPPGTLEDLLQHFDFSTQEKADIVAVLGGRYEEAPILHLALVNPEKRDECIERVAGGAPISTDSIEHLKQRFSHEHWNVVEFFIKKGQEASSQAEQSA